MAPLPGQSIGPYLVENQLGAGGMGVVFLARDTRMGRLVAIKFISDTGNSIERARDRFRREIRAASAINHPGVCTVYDVGEHDGSPYLVMEFLDGESLQQKLKAETALPFGPLLEVGIQVAEALAAAHSKGIMHRDIKPANVFLTQQGNVKLFDFGVAKRFGEGNQSEELPAVTDTPELQTAVGNAVGTVQYMSPEQLRRKPIDPRSDLFSLGVLLYQCATGRLPFKAPVREEVVKQILYQHPAPFGEAAARLPMALQTIVMKCLEKDPDRRYQTASKLAADLRVLRNPDWLQRRRRRVASVALLLVAIVAGGYFVLREKPATPGIRLRRLTANPTEMPVINAVVSPDGRQLAYGDTSGVSLVRLDTGEARALPGLGGYLPLRWSADGSELVLSHPGANPPYARIPVAGDAQPVDIDSGPFLSHPSPRGAYSIQLRSGSDPETVELWSQRSDGSGSRRLLEAPRSFVEVEFSWLPGDRFVVFSYHTSLAQKRRAWTIYLLDVTSGLTLELSAGADANQVSNAVWLKDGKVAVGIRRSTGPQMQLWAVPVDAGRGTWAGELRQVSTFGDFGLFRLRSSDDGRVLVARMFTQQGDIFVADLAGPGKLKSPPTQLTFDLHDDFLGSWTEGSDAVVFAGNRYGTTDIFRQSVDSVHASVLQGGSDFTNTPEICGGGKYLLYTSFEQKAAQWSRLMLSPLGQGGPARVLTTTDKIYYTQSANGICSIDMLETATTRVVQEVDLAAARLRRLFAVEKPGSNVAPVAGGQRFMHFDRGTSAMVVLDRQGRRTGSIPVPMLPGEVVGRINPEFAGGGVYLNNLLPSVLGMRVLYVSLGGEVSEVYRSSSRNTGAVATSPDGKKIAFYLRATDSNLWLVEGL